MERSSKILTGANVALAMFVLGSCLLIAVGAAERMAYSHYLYVRIATSLTAVALAASMEAKRWLFLRPSLIAVAVLYNFVIPIHLTRTVWFPINLVTIALFLMSLYPSMLPKENSDA